MDKNDTIETSEQLWEKLDKLVDNIYDLDDEIIELRDGCGQDKDIKENLDYALEYLENAKNQMDNAKGWLEDFKSDIKRLNRDGR